MNIIAYKSITNSFGIGIINIIEDIDDYVLYTIVTNEKMLKPHKSKIRYNKSGEDYFMDFNRHRHYMNEFLRVNL